MVDVTFIIPPPTQVQTIGAGGQQAQSATQGGVPATPHLSPGALVAGVIAGRDNSGNYLLKTAQGTFTLHSSTPLTYNSDVLIRVDTSGGSNVAARIISVNGEAFASYSAPAEQEADSLSPMLARTAGQQPEAQKAAASNTAPQLQMKPVSIPALTVPVPPQPAGTPSLPPAPIPAGTAVVLHAETPNIPSGSTTPALPAAPPAVTANMATPAGTALAQSPAVTTPAAPLATSPPPLQAVQEKTPENVAKLIVAQPASLPQGSPVPSSLAALVPQQKPQPEQPQAVQTQQYAAYSKTAAAPSQLPPAPPSPQQVLLPATVVSMNTESVLTLASPQGFVALKPDVPAPTLAQGTPVSIALPPALVPALLPALPASPAATLAGTLHQMLTVLQEKLPSAANELASRLPATGPDFLSGSMAFFSALMKGTARKFLGDNVINALHDAGKGDLTEFFTSQAAHVVRSFSQVPAEGNTAPTGWQSLVMPFLHDGALQEARLYVKREPPRKNQPNRRHVSDTRFIVEITFSHIGDLQLDGLVLPKEKGTLFDLIVRTRQPFGAGEKTEIMQIYNNAAQLTGFKGNIVFHVSSEFPVNPQNEMYNQPQQDIIA